MSLKGVADHLEVDLTQLVFFHGGYRSLKGLSDVGAVVALGDGGPGDPKRYCLNPLMAAIGGSKEQYDKAQAIFQSDPGAT